MKKAFLLIPFCFALSSFVLPSFAADRSASSLLDDLLSEKIESAHYRVMTIIAGDGFSSNNKPAFNFHFGKGINDYFSFTAQCDIFNKKSPKTTTIGGDVNRPVISLDYTNNNLKQIMTSEHKFDGYTSLLDVKIDDEKKEFIFIIEAKLYDIKSENTYKVEPQYVTLSRNEMKEIRDGCKAK